MNEEDKKLCRLPKKRTGLRVKWLASWPIWLIGVVGLSLYVAIVVVISAMEWHLSTPSQSWVRATDGSTISWWDFVYFNFTSILTIGYGDYTPNCAAARLVTILESLLGTGILGLTLAALTAKFLSPPSNAVVFSRFAYYCTDDEKFLVIYVNTTRSRMVNAEISSYFKLGGDWMVRPSVRSPFVTRAVQTFFTEFLEQDQLVRLDAMTDAFRFGISGYVGGASVSVAIEYKPDDIIVLPNRDTLTKYPGFWRVDFRSAEFEQMFHYRPVGAMTLIEYVDSVRRQRSID
jgi:hypothetical protein